MSSRRPGAPASGRNKRGSAHSVPLVLGRTAPDAVFLSGLERELQAGAADLTGMAHRLRRPDLLDGAAGAAYREKQVGICEPAPRIFTPSAVDTDISSKVIMLADSHSPPKSVGGGNCPK